MKTVVQSMQHSDTLDSLIQRSERLHSLIKKLSATLPVSLSQHCVIANYRDKSVIFIVESSAWANRLRYLTPDLLRQWQSLPNIQPIEKIHIKIKPLNEKTTHTTALPTPELSSHSATVISCFADNLPHSKLRKVLLKIASRAK